MLSNKMIMKKSKEKDIHQVSSPGIRQKNKYQVQISPIKHKNKNEDANKPNQGFQQQELMQHRKKIEETLTELHRLQAQIYQLNVPQNPHSTSPIKKQIKQLSYLYENMSKPRARNSLDVKSSGIQLALRIINNDWHIQQKLRPQINDNVKLEQNQISLLNKTKPNLKFQPNNTQSNLSSNLRSTLKGQANANNAAINDYYKIPKQRLQQKFEKLTKSPLSISYMSKNQTKSQISTEQLYSFINYTQVQKFDPIEQAYQMFLNEDGLFDLRIYNNFSDILGLPKVKNINTFIAAINHKNSSVNKANKIQSDRVLDTNSNQVNNNQMNHNADHTNTKNVKDRNEPELVAKITLQQFKEILDIQI